MKISKELALFYGILLGDGCISHTKDSYHVIYICGHSEDDHIFFKLIVAPLMRKLTNRKCSITKVKGEKTIVPRSYNKNKYYEIKKLGFPEGKKGPQLNIPQIFKNYMTEIIQGFFSTDGCLVLTNNNGISYPRIEFSSISKKILLQIQEYLLKINIKGGLYISHTYSNDKNKNTLYRLQINGAKNLNNFRKIFPFINQKHNEKYLKYKSAGGGI